MKRNVYSKALLATIVTIFPLFYSLWAQSNNPELQALILQRDSLFWKSYNTCDTAGNKKFFTTDVEFYHDKGGLTLGADALSASMKNNLCGANTFRLRREAIAGSVHVFPLRNNAGIYGAILSGEHVFYVTEQGKKERLDGQAKFTHVWVRQDSVWKMSRILSYDHGPAAYRTNRTETPVSNAVLQQYAGTYKGSKSGTLILQAAHPVLLLLSNGNKMVLYPETPNRFFTKEHDLTFEFIVTEKHGVSKMLVREGGQLAEELVFVK